MPWTGRGTSGIGRRRRSRYLVTIAALLGTAGLGPTPRAAADDANRGVVPFGEREAAFGNAGVTGGVELSSGRTRTGVRAFFMRGSGEHLPGGGPGSRVETVTDVMGAMLATSYSL
jgi:hypothetical protein